LIGKATEPRHIVAIFGSATAGSEAARVLAESGIACVSFDMNPRPYGKIEDGLPRWHEKQRLKEYGKIDGRLDRELVEFVPNTKLGEDIDFQDVYENWGFSAILLAVGAWNDRSVGVDGVDAYVDKGLVYQNPLVGWFNHCHEPGYEGQTYDIPDGAVVIGGGLASIDVVKICQLVAVGRALKEQKGIDAPLNELEHRGIKSYLEKIGVTYEELGLKGVLLIYRRRAIDMPLASEPDNATEAQKLKTQQVRRKLLDNVMEKFYVRFQERTLAQGPIVEDGQMVGLKVIETRVEGRKALPIEGSESELRSPMFISSIGSLPGHIKGVEMDGSYYKYVDWDTGEMEGLKNCWGVGNTVTGQGNIRVSLKHGKAVAAIVAEKLSGDALLSVEAQQSILDRVSARHKELGYESYSSWIEKVKLFDM